MHMNQQQADFKRIAEAIHYIRQNFMQQPSLNDIAENVHLSPVHLQRIFTEWAGIGPTEFMQFISLEYAKGILNENNGLTLFDVAADTDLSSSSHFHHLFVKIEEMSPVEYKTGGKNLSISYDYAESPFGSMLIASTLKGICYMAFEDGKTKAFNDLKSKFPNANFSHESDKIQKNALHIFQNDWNNLKEVKLHLKGTPFQLKVWKNLLKIPMGKLSSYGMLAGQIGHTNASRAVGTAIGSNPVAFLIPCHRVIQSTGLIGGYMWGSNRKAAIIGWEAAKTNPTHKKTQSV